MAFFGTLARVSSQNEGLAITHPNRLQASHTYIQINLKSHQ